MLRIINYAISVAVVNVAFFMLGNPLWVTILFIAITDFCIWLIFQFISDQENVYFLSFAISFPFILHWTERANKVASENVWVLLATIFLSVSLPFIFILLFELWRLAGEE